MNTQTPGLTTDEQEPCRDEKGVCHDTRREHVDFDAHVGDWQAARAENHWGEA